MRLAILPCIIILFTIHNVHLSDSALINYVNSGVTTMNNVSIRFPFVPSSLIADVVLRVRFVVCFFFML